MSFSSSTIANSARRVRERRRMELELQQQKQQQQIPLLAPRSPGSSSTSSSNNRVTKSPRSPRQQAAPLDAELTSTTREGSRSISPQSMMMSMSSVHGFFGSPPASPRVSSVSTTAPLSNGNSSSRPIRLGRTRPPTVSPSSPQQTSRSWDEGESHRPPSPSMRATSPLPSWTLQPKLLPQHQSSPSPQSKLKPRVNGLPRTVAELDTFAPVSGKSGGSYHQAASYLFRRVHSSPLVGPESIANTLKNDGDTEGSIGGAAVNRGDVYRPNERPPVGSSVLNSSSGDDEGSIVGVDDQKCSSPAPSSASSTTSGPTASSLRLLCQAIQSNGPRPAHLSFEEKAVWDAMQTVRRQSRQEGVQQAKKDLQIADGSPTIENNPQSVDTTSWDMGFVELQEQAVSQQRDNSRSLQAIQRVLADVQAERDQVVMRLKDYPPLTEDTVSCTSSASIGGTESDKETMQRDLQAMSAHITSLERELLSGPTEPEVNVTVEPYVTAPFEIDDKLTSTAIDQLEREKEDLLQKLEWKDLVIEQLEKQLESVKSRRDTMDSYDAASSVVSTTNTHSLELDELRKELADKSSALENAKMIIASLENASGSLAADLRRKLREREEDTGQLQKELAEKQRTLDTLATDLRDLQKVKASAIPLQDTEAAQVRRLQLSSRLETNLAEIRAAAVILESTQDATAVSSLSELLSDSASALRDGIDVIENGVEDERRGPLRLHKEVEEKKMTIQRLEQMLRTQTVEIARYKTTTDDILRRRDDEMNALHAEVKILRQQCNTNMEVLTRKERELAVLRDSLRVDDDGVGYISDDEPDDDEQSPAIPSPPSKTSHHLPSEYGPSQAEALATLLSHTGGNHSFDSGMGGGHTAAVAAAAAAVAQSATSNKEIESLKGELNKARTDSEKAQCQLKVEKESLSNAKMIISSLERASKTMMEDLRARLQDSNTAIASLLEKSMESEKTSARLRSELDALKRHQYAYEPDDSQLVLAPPPQPLLLTETID
jgi:hypothetical protein